VRRLRTLSETECDARCYGSGDESVKIVHVERFRLRAAPRLSGEALRALFEERLAARTPEAEAA
jgi:hypothetical protein